MSRNIWFTADTHFGHERIIELCKRPFASVKEMDEELIKRWNDRVKPHDEVVHVGDFSWDAQRPYLARLNGNKILIRGNHDHNITVMKANWDGVYDLWEVPVCDDQVTLCHYALKVWNKAHKGALHLYGHSHGRLPGDNQSLDVGVDCWDYRPVSIEEIKARMATLPPRVVAGHNGAAYDGP